MQTGIRVSSTATAADSSQVQERFFSSLKSIKSKATKIHSKAHFSVRRPPLTLAISVTLPVCEIYLHTKEKLTICCEKFTCTAKRNLQLAV